MKGRDTQGGMATPWIKSGALMVAPAGDSMPVAKVSTPATLQETQIGALAANTDFFTPPMQVGPGASVMAHRVASVAIVQGELIEVQNAVSAAGPWYTAPGDTSNTLARTTVVSLLGDPENVLGVRGRALAPWVRVRYRRASALAAGASIWVVAEQSGR